jgi:Putative lumazine-binding
MREKARMSAASSSGHSAPEAYIRGDLVEVYKRAATTRGPTWGWTEMKPETTPAFHRVRARNGVPTDIGLWPRYLSNDKEIAWGQGEITMTARTDDYDEIVRVMRLYMDGFGKNDVARFREAFHEDAWIFYIDREGKLQKRLISEAFGRWAAPHGRDFVGRIISVNQIGDAASVQLSLDSNSDSKDTWIDFHNLLRIEGKWKITNKTATHSSRVWPKRNHTTGSSRRACRISLERLGECYLAQRKTLSNSQFGLGQMMTI